MNRWPKNFGYRRPDYVNDQKIHVRVLRHFLTSILLRLLFPAHLTVEAPLIGPANNASNPTTAPIAMPAVIPFSFAPEETQRITNISVPVRISSRMSDCRSEPAGTVLPNVWCCGKRIFTRPLAVTAPAI